MLLGSCSKREPIDDFWNFPWGTRYEAIREQLPDFRNRLGGPGFRAESDALRITLTDVQYGMGYAQLTLDFTPEGLLWHGGVRTPVTDPLTVDSTLKTLYERYGAESKRRTIEGAGGTIVWWQTADWLDRDFYAHDLAPVLDPGEVRSIDLLYRGCLTDCPIYSIRFLATGEAYLWGIEGTPHIGGFRARFDTRAFARLASEAVEADLLALNEYYGYEGYNLARRETRIDFGRFVRTHGSVEHCAPATLERFLDLVDSASIGVDWEQIVSWDTVRIIDQPRIGLDSLSCLGAARRRP